MPEKPEKPDKLATSHMEVVRTFLVLLSVCGTGYLVAARVMGC